MQERVQEVKRVWCELLDERLIIILIKHALKILNSKFFMLKNFVEGSGWWGGMGECSPHVKLAPPVKRLGL